MKSKANDQLDISQDQDDLMPYIVQYSDKCIAVFGNTKPIKDELKSLGGRFNKYLTQNSMKIPGWVFPTKDKDAVMSIISSSPKKSNVAESEVVSILSATSYNDPISTILDEEVPNNAYIVQYSDKCIAVFGNTKPIKDELKSLGGRFNKYLTQNSMKIPGWVFPTKDKDAVMSIISSKNTSNELSLHPDKKRKLDD